MSSSTAFPSSSSSQASAGALSQMDTKAVEVALPLMLCLDHAATHHSELNGIIKEFRENRLRLIQTAFKTSPLLLKHSLTHRTAVACLLNILRNPSSLKHNQNMSEALDWLGVISPGHFPRDVNSVFFFIVTELKVQAVFSAMQSDDDRFAMSEADYAQALQLWFTKVSTSDLFHPPHEDRADFDRKCNVMRKLRNEIRTFWQIVTNRDSDAKSEFDSKMFLKKHSITMLQETVKNYGEYTARKMGFYNEHSLLDLLVRSHMPDFLIKHPDRASAVGLQWAQEARAQMIEDLNSAKIPSSSISTPTSIAADHVTHPIKEVQLESASNDAANRDSMEVKSANNSERVAYTSSSETVTVTVSVTNKPSSSDPLTASTEVKTSEKSPETSADKSTDKSADKSTDKSADKSTDKSKEKNKEKNKEKSKDKSKDKNSEKESDKTQESNEGQSVESTAEMKSGEGKEPQKQQKASKNEKKNAAQVESEKKLDNTEAKSDSTKADAQGVSTSEKTKKKRSSSKKVAQEDVPDAKANPSTTKEAESLASPDQSVPTTDTVTSEEKSDIGLGEKRKAEQENASTETSKRVSGVMGPEGDAKGTATVTEAAKVPVVNETSNSVSASSKTAVKAPPKSTMTEEQRKYEVAVYRELLTLMKEVGPDVPKLQERSKILAKLPVEDLKARIRKWENASK